MRINLEDKSIKWVGTHVWNSGLGYNPNVELAISNDGRFIAWGGWNVTASMMEVDDSCGLSSTEGFYSDWLTGNSYEHLTNPCPEAYVSSKLHALANPTGWNFFPSDPRFSEDGGELSYWWNGEFKLKAHGYSGPEPIGYLAMGDSFASGEGDIDTISNTNVDWYAEGTNINGDYSIGVPREKCHVSMQSYPYLLRKVMKTEGVFKSVACSGALLGDIAGDNTIYSGQPRGGDELANLGRLYGLTNRSYLKSEGLSNTIPGRNTQIEFVKRLKPKTITVMGGGNDIQFADKLENCVISIGTCKWATISGRPILKSEIDAIYDDLLQSYQEIYDKSDGAKVYVIGYPQFISPELDVSCSSIHNLHFEEREMIYYAVQYLNETIQKAARAAGVKYIDIENSLDGGRICDTDKPYINPITATKPIIGALLSDLWMHEKQEAFHPNARGHAKIAKAIYQQLNSKSFEEFDICPDVASNVCPSVYILDTPEYFTSITDQINAKVQQMTSNTAPKSSVRTVEIPDYTLKLGSQVTVEIHSDPTDIATVTVNAEGGLSEEITIPSSIEAGYHTLVVKGKTYSGEDIQLSQAIEIIGVNANDRDDDGIEDSIDKCLYIPQLNIDADLDGIDDGCDPYVSPSPLLYRARTGNESRLYGGQPEVEDYIYIERNTRANAIMGVNGDTDPDGDGWAIVGVSSGVSYTTTTTPDTGPIAHFEVIGEGLAAKPYVYIRAGGYGCTSFTPASLSKVGTNQNRTIKKVTANTSACRSAEPSEDLDFNGIADDEQPLYMARKGDVNVQHELPSGAIFTEDPARLYIFRSYHAAEAQLGISDYSPTGTAAGEPNELIQSWNLIASTQTVQYIPDFNNLSIVQDANGIPSPIILTRKQNGQCVAYAPESTEVIKKTTQYTRDILKLNQMPQGVGCE